MGEHRGQEKKPFPLALANHRRKAYRMCLGEEKGEEMEEEEEKEEEAARESICRVNSPRRACRLGACSGAPLAAKR